MPARVVLSGSCDPWDLAARLADEPRCVAFIGEWGPGGCLFADRPSRVLTASDPFDTVDDDRSGAWAGWWGYAAPDEPSACELARYDHVLVRDADGAWVLERTIEDAPVDPDAVRRWQQRIVDAGSEPDPAFSVGPPAAVPDRAGHVGAVEQTVLAIAAGDFFQANVCMGLHAAFSGSALGLWCTAGRDLAPPRAAFVGAPGRAVASLSPEVFLTRHGDRAVTQPIKGTRPLTAAGRDELTSAEKDAAEHVMIVDLVRNDLASVSVPGSVRVDRFTEARPLSGVWHLESAVSADVQVPDGALLRAMFPPGSVTGAPKPAAMAWCDLVEPEDRGAYCGAIGFSSPVHGLQANVAIRTIEITGDHLRLGVGGGIVADSGPVQEWEECRAKAAPVLTALGAPPWQEPTPPGAPAGRAVFETMLVIDGIVLDLESHTRRIAGWLVDARKFRAVVADAAAALGPGAHRLRVTDDLQVTSSTMTLPSLLEGRLGEVTLRSHDLPGGNGAGKWADRSALLAAESATAPDEPLLVDCGQVLETTRANVLVLLDGIWHTPPADGRILPGTARRAVLDCLFDARRGLATEPRRAAPPALQIGPIRARDLHRAETVIVTNALRGLWWVPRIDETSWDRPAPAVSDLAERLRSRWLAQLGG